MGPDWKPKVALSSIPFLALMLLEVISFHNEPRMQCSQQDWAVGKQRGFASLWLLLLHQVRWTGASGSEQCLYPKGRSYQASYTSFHFPRVKAYFLTSPAVEISSVWELIWFTSEHFDLFGNSFIKAKPFSVRKIKSYFTKEHISFCPSERAG